MADFHHQQRRYDQRCWSGLFHYVVMLTGFAAATHHLDARELESCSLTVQPVVVRGDDGAQPAPHRIVEPVIDQIYGTASVDIHFVEPLTMNDTAARDGLVSMDEVVRRAQQQRLMRGPGRLMTLLFVRQMDADTQPVKFARGPGGCAMVVLDEAPDAATDALRVARAMALALGLGEVHENDPPQDGSRNVLKRDDSTAPNTAIVFNDDQIAALRAHPLVRPHVYCLPRAEAQRVMLDESHELYFSNMQRREIAAITGAVVRAESLEECRDQARLSFFEGTRAFTDRESASLAQLVQSIEQRLGEQYPLLRNQPWRFVKFDDRLCGGFPHTRGDCILLSARVVEAISASALAEDDAGSMRFASLLVHEQMHVLERLYPARFASFATELAGLTRADVADHPWLIERQIQNPDALRLEWLISRAASDEGPQWWWPRTILTGTSLVPRMGVDWQAVAVQVEPQEDGRFAVVTDSKGVPVVRPLRELAHLTEPYAMRGPGRDHPNELAAYASAQLLAEEGANGARNEQFLTWCREHLR